MAESKNKNIIKPLLIIILLLLAVGLVIGGIFYFPKEKKQTPKTEETLPVKFYKAAGVEVNGLDYIDHDLRFAYSERVVKGIDDKGENIYTTGIYLTDAKGGNKYKFYAAEDLTYEVIYPYVKDRLLILTEFGRQKNRLIDLVGGPADDVFSPPVTFGTDFILSDDERYVGYLEAETSGVSQPDQDLKYRIKAKDLLTGTTVDFDSSQIKHGEQAFTQFLPVGISSSSRKLFVFASQIISQNIFENPSGLYSLNLDNKEINEIFFSSVEENEDKDRVVLIGVYPEFNFALINRGPQLNKNDKTIFRTQLQKINLASGQATDLYSDEYLDRVGSGGRILSPDGKKIILLNDAYHDRGLTLLDIATSSKKKLTDQGEFVGWFPDNKTIIYQLYLAETSEAGLISESVEIHTLNTETAEDYQIYTQNSLNEGTGINQIGDTFYSFIGVL